MWFSTKNFFGEIIFKHRNSNILHRIILSNILAGFFFKYDGYYMYLIFLINSYDMHRWNQISIDYHLKKWGKTGVIVNPR